MNKYKVFRGRFFSAHLCDTGPDARNLLHCGPAVVSNLTNSVINCRQHKAQMQFPIHKDSQAPELPSEGGRPARGSATRSPPPLLASSPEDGSVKEAN